MNLWLNPRKTLISNGPQPLCGPTTARGIGGYLSGDTLTGAFGEVIARRVELDKASRIYVDCAAGDFIPAIVRLPHGRIYAGWSMGEGMVTDLSAGPFDDEDEAWYAAKQETEDAANAEAEYQETHREDEDEE